ncbi:MAG: hypothetical protein ACYDHW_12810 [Syntrophorhabdaceae bacterium]
MNLTLFTRKKTGFAGECVQAPQRIIRFTATFPASKLHALNPYQVKFITGHLISGKLHSAGSQILDSLNKTRIKLEEPGNITMFVIDNAPATRAADHFSRQNIVDTIFAEKKTVETSSANESGISRKHSDSFHVFKLSLILTNETGVCNVKS